jgi:hypothetical protein
MITVSEYAGGMSWVKVGSRDGYIGKQQGIKRRAEDNETSHLLQPQPWASALNTISV